MVLPKINQIQIDDVFDDFLLERIDDKKLRKVYYGPFQQEHTALYVLSEVLLFKGDIKRESLKSYYGAFHDRMKNYPRPFIPEPGTKIEETVNKVLEDIEANPEVYESKFDEAYNANPKVGDYIDRASKGIGDIEPDTARALIGAFYMLIQRSANRDIEMSKLKLPSGSISNVLH